MRTFGTINITLIFAPNFLKVPTLCGTQGPRRTTSSRGCTQWWRSGNDWHYTGGAKSWEVSLRAHRVGSWKLDQSCLIRHNENLTAFYSMSAVWVSYLSAVPELTVKPLTSASLINNQYQTNSMLGELMILVIPWLLMDDLSSRIQHHESHMSIFSNVCLI